MVVLASFKAAEVPPTVENVPLMEDKYRLLTVENKYPQHTVHMLQSVTVIYELGLWRNPVFVYQTDNFWTPNTSKIKPNTIIISTNLPFPA